MARSDRRHYWVGLRASDVVAIVFVIGLLSVTLGALLATPDARLLDHAERWLHVTIQRFAPGASVSHAEATASTRADAGNR